MSVDNTDDRLFLTIASIKTEKPYLRPASANSSSSSSTPRTVYTSTLSPSYALLAALTSFSKSYKNIKSL